jgi:hypothetical protein
LIQENENQIFIIRPVPRCTEYLPGLLPMHLEQITTYLLVFTWTNLK